jgi:Rrf2 family protein
MKMLSKSSLYGIKALLYLASEPSHDFIPINYISDNTEIPFHYLTKIFQHLGKKGIIESQKGARGGVKLLLTPNNISLGDIVNAIDSVSFTYSNHELEKFLQYKKLTLLLNTSENEKIKNIYDTTLDNLLN